MRTILVVVAVFAAFGTACGEMCTPVSGAAVPDLLCRSTDAGSTVIADVSFRASSCRVTADAGTLTFEMAGSSCSSGNNPVVFGSKVACDVSAIPAGTYTTRVGGASTATLALPLVADGGIADCR